MPNSKNTPSHRQNQTGQHNFAAVPSVSAPRSAFNRSCGIKTAFNVGDVIPIFVDEALPGDTMALRLTQLSRFATLLKPVMENVYLDFFFFAVPNRLVWDNWQKFMGEQTDPGDSIDFLVPEMDSPAGTGYDEETLFDYMGLPTKVADLTHNTLALRAYNLIWNEWFRDENLQDSVPVRTGDSGDLVADYEILKRGKRHDYFTSCLPFPQKGAAVELPLGTSAPVAITGSGHPSFDVSSGTDRGLIIDSTGDSPPNNMIFEGSSLADTTTPAVWNDPALDGTVDLSSATAATINQIRQAFQIQKLLERDARGGTRYTEILLSHFGVMSPDQRLQRPEYLGGGSSRISVNTVAQTFEVTGSNPVANLGAYGISVDQPAGFTKSFTEHCVVIGLVSARADLNYQQGLDRMWSRSTRYDFAWPTLAHIGEQEVLNKEIFAQGVAADEDAFGYQERYAEYRYKPSKITGIMRSNAAQSLDFWHLAQDFASLPALNDEFIEENPPVDRILAVTDEADIIMDGAFDFRHVRPLPVYSVPGFVDHF